MSVEDIVLVSTADWDNPFWTNKQHVAMQLAKAGHRVLYIDSLGLRRPSMSSRDLRRIVRRLLKALRPPKQVADRIWVWSPIVLPWHGHALVRRMNRWLLGAGLWFWKKRLQFSRPWLWTYNPLTTEFFDLRKFSCGIYHCVDEIKAQPGMPVKTLARSEERLCHAVNVIFTTSIELTESRRQWNPHTYYLPNVADYDHFHQALDAQTPVARDLESIPGPRLGFIGAISGYKVDFPLLRRIAELRPDWSIVLIGEVGEGDPWTDSSILEGVPNIHLLGPRAYQDLPTYLKGIDVALLPNRINEYTASMFPMKFFEYLAAGRPVVGVPLRSLEEFANVALFAQTAEPFVDAVERSLMGVIPSLESRLAVARQYTYETRTRRMLEIVGENCEV